MLAGLNSDKNCSYLTIIMKKFDLLAVENRQHWGASLYFITLNHSTILPLIYYPTTFQR